MEHLFSPCTRLHALLESQGLEEWFRRQHPELLQELNLKVSTEELLSAQRTYTYADLYATLGNGNTVLWLTPHAAVVRGDAADLYRFFYRFSFKVDGNDIYAFSRSSEALSEIVDVVRRLFLADAREVNELKLVDIDQSGEVFFDAPSFAYLMEHCQNLKALTLERMILDEGHVRVLGDFSKLSLEIELKDCRITGASAAILAEVLGRNQGPTKLDCCDIDNSVLADGLRGNSRLKSLRPRLSGNPDVGNQEVLAIAGGLRENKGLVDLDLQHDFSINEYTWVVVCDSLKTHPTLEILSLLSNRVFPPAELKPWVQALVDMMKVNTSIHTIHLHFRHREHELFQGSVIPYLETNQFRPRLLALQKVLPIAYRAKVLGRALLAVRTDPNRFWMILSENAEVAFP